MTEQTQQDEPRGILQLMRSGPFSRLWRAGLISSTGDWVAILATISLAEELAGGSGIVFALGSRILPGLFFAAIGGVIADRLNRKTVMLVVEVARASLVFSIVFVNSIGMLVLVNLALEAFTLVFQPAKEATVPNLVRRSELVQANSLSLSAAYGTFPLGAAIFLLIAPLAPHVTFWGLLDGSNEDLAFVVDAMTYFASALIIWTLPNLGRALPAERRRRKGRVDLLGPLRDLWEGIRFVATHPRVRPVVGSMTVGLAGGGIIVVLAKPYARNVLLTGSTGYAALLTAFGFGAALGIVLVTIFGPRFTHKDILFGLALVVTGIALGAAGLVKTILGGVGWILVMGLGAGAGYVLGFAHLHEQTSDEIRGRTFAALFSLIRIGLLTAMTAALPVAGLLDGVFPGLLADGDRVVLILGGLTILLAGVATLWSVRRVLVQLGQVDRSRTIGAATEAFRSYRKSLSGRDPEPTVEMDAIVEDDDGSPG